MDNSNYFYYYITKLKNSGYPGYATFLQKVYEGKYLPLLENNEDPRTILYHKVLTILKTSEQNKQDINSLCLELKSLIPKETEKKNIPTMDTFSSEEER